VSVTPCNAIAYKSFDFMFLWLSSTLVFALFLKAVWQQKSG